MKSSRSILLFVFVSSLAMVAYASPDNAPARSNDSPQSEAASGGEQAASLPEAAPLKGLSWVKGEPVSFKKGKVYVVEFWATWCGPCKVSIPHLTELQQQYKDKGVTIVGISSEQPETVKAYVRDAGDQMAYTVAVDTEGFVNKNYMQAFNKQGIPQAFIVNQAGKIVWEGHPMTDMDTVLAQVVKGEFDPAAYAKAKAEAERLQRLVNEWFMTYFSTLEQGSLTDEAKQAGQHILEQAPADALNAFAWNILTRVPEDKRDRQMALKAAEKANTQTDSKDASVLDTYALALFETGKVQEAVKTAQKAVDLAADYPQAQAEFKQRLQRYKDALGDEI